MISVCMATKNGATYLSEQLGSILSQLAKRDELIISDDCSTDDTSLIISSMKDSRIKVLRSPKPLGVAKNFETALRQSSGDLIFLADQDDVWFPEKTAVMKQHLNHNDLVISDCIITDKELRPIRNSFFEMNGSRSGLLKNLVRNSYMGCCMAFRRNVLDRALPFPEQISVHDFWIGLVAEKYYQIEFINRPLMFHRRHTVNASTTSDKSRTPLGLRLQNRYRLIQNIITR
jgi:glycosyltransferase involved in cell wall biosynthesis